MKFRWILIVVALLAAIAFAFSVQMGRWWSIAEVEIGPFGSRHCFEQGECRSAGLAWIGGDARWMRLGIATWAGSLISMFVLLMLAAGLAAKRVPRLVAKCALVAIATAAIAGTGFIALFPGVAGASLGRGAWLFGVALLLGVVAALGVLRGPRAG